MENYDTEKIRYFKQKGAVNTGKTIDIALAACKDKNIKKMVVASSSGKTALELAKAAAGHDIRIIAVTYSAGARFKDEVEEFNKNRSRLEDKGIDIVKGLHALSGVERAFETRHKTAMTPLNIVADTLRLFCHGVKVCVEIAVMAAEHGFITPDEEVVVIGGSHKGADTATIIKPAYGANLFDMKIRALLCMPVPE